MSLRGAAQQISISQFLFFSHIQIFRKSCVDGHHANSSLQLMSVPVKGSISLSLHYWSRSAAECRQSWHKHGCAPCDFICVSSRSCSFTALLLKHTPVSARWSSSSLRMRSSSFVCGTEASNFDWRYCARRATNQIVLWAGHRATRQTEGGCCLIRAKTTQTLIDLSDRQSDKNDVRRLSVIAVDYCCDYKQQNGLYFIQTMTGSENESESKRLFW